MNPKGYDPPWLADYQSQQYQWREIPSQPCPESHRTVHRPIGNVEFSFDSDGRFGEGRADLQVEILLNLQSSLSSTELRQRIGLAWTCLRCTHWLHQASSRYISNQFRPDFVINIPRTTEIAIGDALSSIVFLDDHFPGLDHQDYWHHSLNAARVLDPERELARLFVSSPEAGVQGRLQLRLVLVAAHQITDGLASSIAKRDLIRLLNEPLNELHRILHQAISSPAILSIFPLPQEALYPTIPGSPARQRWYWLLTRILRHVRKPLPAAFPNPLLNRIEPMMTAVLPPTYAPVLKYDRLPANSTAMSFARASIPATQRLHRLCRQVNASIGAGCFALIALIHMEMYEQEFPHVALADRRPFICGFPLNPRPMFNHHAEPNSVMLAFCDGILLPFLSSSLPVQARLRLLTRQAHRQLSSFQKRRFQVSNLRPPNPASSPSTPAIQTIDPSLSRSLALQAFSSRGPERVLSNQYLGSIERAQMLLPLNSRLPDAARLNPQGRFPARMNTTLSTCNISSVGKSDPMLRPGVYNLEHSSRDLVADLVHTRSCVRSRPGEFLVGVGGDDAGLWVNVSVDSSAMDPALVEQWRKRFLTVLEEAD